MKKALFILAMILFMASCSDLAIRNEEGFRLFAYPHFVYGDMVCIQSLDGFTVAGVAYTEFVGEKPVTVKNESSLEITIKVTDTESTRYLPLAPGAAVSFVVPE